MQFNQKFINQSRNKACLVTSDYNLKSEMNFLSFLACKKEFLKPKSVEFILLWAIKGVNLQPTGFIEGVKGLCWKIWMTDDDYDYSLERRGEHISKLVMRHVPHTGICNVPVHSDSKNSWHLTLSLNKGTQWILLTVVITPPGSLMMGLVWYSTPLYYFVIRLWQQGTQQQHTISFFC